MVRDEENKMNYLAGIDFLNYLYNDFKYPFEALIFCGDVDYARKNCEEK